MVEHREKERGERKGAKGEWRDSWGVEKRDGEFTSGTEGEYYSTSSRETPSRCGRVRGEKRRKKKELTRSRGRIPALHVEEGRKGTRARK